VKSGAVVAQRVRHDRNVLFVGIITNQKAARLVKITTWSSRQMTLDPYVIG
jgi:hypothetical protein